MCSMLLKPALANSLSARGWLYTADSRVLSCVMVPLKTISTPTNQRPFSTPPVSETAPTSSAGTRPHHRWWSSGSGST